MDRTPLVSVIIPTHNCRRWLFQAVESVFANGVDDLECIVVDDGSTDGTAADLEARGLLGRVTYEVQRQKGPAAARNHGIAQARGRYIALLDADDTWVPGKLERQLRVLEDDTALRLCVCDLAVVDESLRFIRARRNVVPQDPRACIRAFFLGRVQRVTPTALFPRGAWESVGGFDEDLARREDHFFFMKLVAEGGAAKVPGLLVLNRERTGSLRDTGRADLLAMNAPFIEKSVLRFPWLGQDRRRVEADLVMAQAAIERDSGNRSRAVGLARAALSQARPRLERLIRFALICAPGGARLKRFVKRLVKGA